ncbi:MAG: YciI family protein [Flavisolibacter sp.]
MKEFMLFIRTEGDPWQLMSPEQMQAHVQKGVNYIGGLMEKGILKSAQPLDMTGKMVTGATGALKDGPFNETKEVIAGYFHIVAKDIDEAIAIAKKNPIFEDGLGAKIEVRPVRTVEGIN